MDGSILNMVVALHSARSNNALHLTVSAVTRVDALPAGERERCADEGRTESEEKT